MTNKPRTAKPASDLINPMWDELECEVRPSEFPWEGPQVGRLGDLGRRFDIVGEYAWTITDPATVAFVGEHCGPKVIDPLAGSGYWAYLLDQLGADVAVFDMAPPGARDNRYHRAGVVHVPVVEADARAAVAAHGEGRTLLLSWPPYDTSVGVEVLAAYPGDRVVYIGEGEGGCCGDDAMFEAFERDWAEVAGHTPVQFWGIHDRITVYERRGGAA